MPRLLIALLAIVPLRAELVVDTHAGGIIRSGVPAQDVYIPTVNGLTWDRSGNIVFCDINDNVIRRIRPDGIMETIVGTGVTGFGGDGGPALDAVLDRPTTPRYDTAGNLYFHDSNNNRIRRVDMNGLITTIAGDGQVRVTGLDTAGSATSRSLPFPAYGGGFAFDAAGNVNICGPNGVWRLTSGGFENFANLPSSDGSPTGLASDDAGNIYVLMNGARTPSIYRISPDGFIDKFFTFPFSQVFYQISGPSTDAAGNIYVLFNRQLVRLTPDRTSTPIATPSGGAFDQYAIDRQGNIAFLTNGSDQSTLVIQTFSVLGVQKTVAGGDPKPAPDGTPLRDAWFLSLGSIAFSHNGDLYITETGPCLIRKISAAGVLVTFAGTGKCGPTRPSGNAKTADLYHVSRIAIDSKDRIWVTDTLSNLYSISLDGLISTAPTSFSGIQGISIDAKDRVYVLGTNSLCRIVADNSCQSIVSGRFLFGIGASSAGNVYFVRSEGTYVVNDDASFTLKYPNFLSFSMAFDRRGNPWGTNGTLRTSNPSGIADVGALAGFAGDSGPAQSARTAAFNSVAFGPDGDLYFVEFNRIRRFTGFGLAVPPVISPNGIVNAANYAPGPVAPGELVSIFGSNFGTPGLQLNTAVNNAIPFTLGRTKVLFDNLPGAIAAITPNQINVFVPYEITPGTPVNIQVQVDDLLSMPFPIAVFPAAPGFSTPSLNQDGTLNRAANPAPRGSIVSFFGTGLGSMTPQLNDGNLAISTPYSAPVNSPSLTIGGQPATILYAGDAPTLPTGVFQINATIPAGITPGSAAVSLAIGGSSTRAMIEVK